MSLFVGLCHPLRSVGRGLARDAYNVVPPACRSRCIAARSHHLEEEDSARTRGCGSIACPPSWPLESVCSVVCAIYFTTHLNAQVNVLGALPLRNMSRVWGYLNSLELPVWFRPAGLKFYAWMFGCNLDEIEPSDLAAYPSLGEFFYRQLKPGARPIAEAPLVSDISRSVICCVLTKHLGRCHPLTAGSLILARSSMRELNR